MTDKEIAKKKSEFMTKWKWSVYDPEVPKIIWQFIEELIQHYYTQGKIEGYKECLEETKDNGKDPWLEPY